MHIENILSRIDVTKSRDQICVAFIFNNYHYYHRLELQGVLSDLISVCN